MLGGGFCFWWIMASSGFLRIKKKKIQKNEE
jgi:hypothetical protein